MSYLWWPVQTAPPACLQRKAHSPPGTHRGWCPWPTSPPAFRSPAAESPPERCTLEYHTPGWWRGEGGTGTKRDKHGKKDGFQLTDKIPRVQITSLYVFLNYGPFRYNVRRVKCCGLWLFSLIPHWNNLWMNLLVDETSETSNSERSGKVS